jgi:SAM-dependent methyltransferase
MRRRSLERSVRPPAWPPLEPMMSAVRHVERDISFPSEGHFAMNDDRGLTEREADEWKAFFSGPVAAAWSDLIPDEHYVDEADIIGATGAFSEGTRLLDVPCGDGRLSLELAKRGHQVTGVDSSHDFLRRAREGRGSYSSLVSFEHGDMCHFPAQTGFGGALCWGNSFGYSDQEGLRRYLRSIFASLVPGSPFLIDLFMVAECILPHFQEEICVHRGDSGVVVSNRYDPFRRLIRATYNFTHRGERMVREGSHLVYTISEVCELLTGEGFLVREVHGQSGREPFRIGCHRAIVVSTASLG